MTKPCCPPPSTLFFAKKAKLFQLGFVGTFPLVCLIVSILSVTGHYLASAGFDTSDPRILRLVSLAAQKFVSDVAGEALQHARLRGGAVGTGTAGSRKGSKERNAVMTTEDLASALGEQGVVVKKPPYFQ